MEYLRSLGTAAASSLLAKSGITLPFSLGNKVAYLEGRSIWTLYDAIKRVRGPRYIHCIRVSESS